MSEKWKGIFFAPRVCSLLGLLSWAVHFLCSISWFLAKSALNTVGDTEAVFDLIDCVYAIVILITILKEHFLFCCLAL